MLSCAAGSQLANHPTKALAKQVRWILQCKTHHYPQLVHDIRVAKCQEEVFKRREEGLKKKDLELQESLIRFSKFLQENDAKRMHALKKAQDERKTREEKEREVEQLVRDHIHIPLVQPITRQVAAMLSSCAA